jgi:predicted amidophosphoribosyltransferase
MSGYNFCPGCGQKLQPQFQSCPGCGMRLRRDESASPPPPPPTPTRPTITRQPPEQDFRLPYQWMEQQPNAPRQVEPLPPTPTPQAQPQGPAQPAPYRPPVVVSHLFNCPSCNQPVARGSHACPHCGRPFQFAPQPQPFQGPSTSNPTPNWIAIVCIALLAAILIMYLC